MEKYTRFQMSPVMRYCSVENGSFILGILSSIVSSAAILFTIYLMIAIISTKSHDRISEGLGIIYLVFLGIFLFISVLNLIFSVFLSHGVVKRNASYIGLYHMCGQLLMAFGIFVAFIFILAVYKDPLALFWTVSFCIVYIIVHSLLLHMVHMTYKKFSEQPAPILPQENI